MTTLRSSPPRRAPAPLLLLALGLGACVDGSPLMPSPGQAPTVAIPAMQCLVDVEAQSMTCTPPDPVQSRLAIAANRMLGNQDVYVKLANSGNVYDAGTETFRTMVTVQNLLARPLGTSDGTTVDGVKVYFFSGPTPTTGGSGEVTVANPTGYQFFTEANQPYFLYSEILEPYEISRPLEWIFNVPTTARRFSFQVYVDAPQADESLPLLDAIWEGDADASWITAANWQSGMVPGASSTVAVPPDSLLAGVMPVLAGDVAISHLRVGGGSTLDLAGYTLTAAGNVDTPGTISGGVLQMTAQGSVLRGTIPSLQVTGGVRLQGPVRATAAVTVSGGSLTAGSGNPLTISVP